MVKHMMEAIVKELMERGYQAEEVSITKNGIERKGIAIGEGKARPTLYPDFSGGGKTVKDFVDEIINLYENLEVPNFPDDISSWEFIKENMFLCIRPKTNENILKRDFLDLEMYIRVKVLEDGTYIVKPGVITEVSEDEAFATALANTKKEEHVEDMLDLLLSTGLYEKEDLELPPGTPSQIVLTNNKKLYGAAVICDKELLMNLAEKYNSNLVILPSSIHDCIVMAENAPNMKMFSGMVKEVNATSLVAEDVLSDHAYFFNKETNEITW